MALWEQGVAGVSVTVSCAVIPKTLCPLGHQAQRWAREVTRSQAAYSPAALCLSGAEKGGVECKVPESLT